MSTTHQFFFFVFSVDQFEYTQECIVFDLLGIQLLHGWVIDPQNNELQKIINSNSLSYNQLVEKMIRQKQSNLEYLAQESKAMIFLFVLLPYL